MQFFAKSLYISLTGRYFHGEENDILAGFASNDSDNAHVLEQFFGMDELTAGQIAALERAVDAGEAVEDSGGDSAAVIAAIEAELSTETFAAAEQIKVALTSQQGETPADVIAAVEEVIDEHYLNQIKQLSNDEKNLKKKIIKFREDELHHKDIAYEEGASKKGLYYFMDKVIKTGSKIAINISEKI